MATATLSMEEYLQTSYRPDLEFVDGELRDRNVGKWEHARMQWLLAGWFMNHEGEWGTIGSTGQRMQVSASRVRVPALVVLRPGAQPNVLQQPPLLVIEILSPDDTYSETQERSQDYLAMGLQPSGSSTRRRARAGCVVVRSGSPPTGWRLRARPCMSSCRRSSRGLVSVSRSCAARK